MSKKPESRAKKQQVLSLLKNRIKPSKYHDKPLVRNSEGRLAHVFEIAGDELENIAVVRYVDSGEISYENVNHLTSREYNTNILVKTRQGRRARSLYKAEDGAESVLVLEYIDDGTTEIRRMDSIEVVEEIDPFLLSEDEGRGSDQLDIDLDEADGFLDDSEDLSTMFERALVHQDAQVAKTLFEKVLKFDPENSDALYQLGLLHEEDFHDSEMAQKFYERAVELDPEHTDALFTLGLLYENVYFDADEARRYYERAVACKPDSANIYNNLGLLLMNHFQEYDEARKLYEDAIAVEPTDVYAYNNLALLLTSVYQDYASAKSMYIRAIEVDPDYIRGYNNLALLHVTLGEIQDAFDIYQKLLKMYKDDKTHQAHQRYNLAVLYSKTQDVDKAIHQYEKAIELNPTDILSLNNLGLLLETYYENFERAKRLYEDAIKVDPNSLQAFCAYHNLALLLITQYGETDKAEEIYRFLIQQDCDDVKSFYNLALLATDKKNYKESEKYYKKCIVLDPENSKAYTNLGLIYKDHLNRKKEAIKMFREALNQSNDPIALQSLRELGVKVPEAPPSSIP